MTNSSLLLFSIALIVGCGETSPGDSPTSSWAVGSYVSPPYRADGNEDPTQGLIVDADGTWTHSIEGRVDREDAWTSSGPGSLTLGDNTVPMESNCRILVFEGSAYYRSDRVAACPTRPLSPLEYCLVGKFEKRSSSDFDSIIDTLELQEDRTYIYEYIRVTSSDETFFTNLKFWRVEGNELLTELDGYVERTALTAAYFQELDDMRIGAPDPRCDASQLRSR